MNVSSVEGQSLQEENEMGIQFSTNAAKAVIALNNQDTESYGVNPDGSRWWRETGIEQRLDDVVCKWTLTRGVSADEVTEWEEKYWETADEFDYKELGSEKSGRDTWGNVWREYWKEYSMWQVCCNSCSVTMKNRQSDQELVEHHLKKRLLLMGIDPHTHEHLVTCYGPALTAGTMGECQAGSRG